jgi:hypothetical protein
MSPKSIAEKLLIKPQTSVWSSHPDRLELLGPLPPGTRVVHRPDEATTAVVFGDDAESLREALAAQADHLSAPETLWVAYPKGNRSDINRDTVWPIVAAYGMRPIGQVALGDVWSALRFRLLQPGEAQFRGGAGS